jgi:Fibronectin type III domain
MANRSLILLGFLLLALAAPDVWGQPTPTPPTSGITPIKNGKLISPLDANGFQILNLDTSNLPSGGGGGGLSSITGDNGSATGLTLTISHVTGTNLTDPIFTLGATLGVAHGGTGQTSISAFKTAAALDNLDNTSDLNKPISTATQTALNLKAAITYVDTGLGLKADTTALTTGLATKEPTLPTTGNDSYILARHNSGSGSAWFFVDPVTLGTTSQSFTDGVENSTTTLTSATAIFVAGDVGKTITGDNIPAGTTIASRTNGTTIVMSQAATSTSSGNHFTIVNRLEVGGTGTVTSVGVTNNATNLITTTVGNPTTSATITIDPVAPGAHTFYGNNTGSPTAPIFMTQGQALNNLGGTVVGQALFQASSIGVFSYPRINNDNTVTLLNRASTLSDLGAAPAFTVSSPLALTLGNLTVGTATSTTTGVLTFTDWGNFNAKVPNSRTLTATAPLRISTSGAPLSGAPGSDLSANRTLDMPAATATVDGYMRGSDFNRFAGLSGNPTTATNGGTFGINPTAVPVITRVNLIVLTSNLIIDLPPAINYDTGAYVELVDVTGTGAMATNNKTITVRKLATTNDTIDGISQIVLPKGSTYFRYTSDGNSKWTSTVYYVTGFKDPVTPTKYVVVDVSGQPTPSPGPSNTFRPATAGDSVSVVPTSSPAPAGGVLRSITASGTAPVSQLSPTELLPNAGQVGSTGNDIAGGFIYSASGTPDTIAILGTLTGSLTIKLPDADSYNPYTHVTVVDYSGSVNKTHPVTITSINGTDTFNGPDNLSFIFDEANGTRILTTGPDNSNNWSVPTQKATVNQGFQILSSSGGNVTVTPDPTVSGAQKAYISLASGVNNLLIPSPFDGMQVLLMLVQPGGGSATINLPIGSATSGGGAGLLSPGLTSTGGAVDMIEGVYLGGAATWEWKQPTLNFTTAALPAAPSALSAVVGTPNTTAIDLSWTDNSSNETGFEIFRSVGNNTSYGTSPLITRAAGLTTYTNSGLTPNTLYYYKVRAVNTGGTSSFATEASATTNAACATSGVTNGNGTTGGAGFATGTGSTYLASRFVAVSGDTAVCRINAYLFYTSASQPSAALNQTFAMEIRADTGTGPASGAALYTSSNTVTATDIWNRATTNAAALLSPTSFTFSGVSLSVGTTYWVVMHSVGDVLAVTPGANHPSWSQQGVGGLPTYKAGAGLTWSSTGSNQKNYFITFH